MIERHVGNMYKMITMEWLDRISVRNVQNDGPGFSEWTIDLVHFSETSIG